MEGEYGNHKLEETQKVEIESGDEKVEESVTKENSDAFKESSNGDGSSLSTNVVDSEATEGNGVLDSILEIVPSFESIKPDELLSEAIAPFEGNPDENLGDSDVNQVESKFEKIVPLSNENGGISPVVTDLVERETEPCLEENGGASLSVTDSTSVGVEEEMLPASDENIGESSYGAMDLVSKENVSNMLQAAEIPCVEAGNGVENSSKGNVIPSDDVENNNKSEVPKSIENQPFIAVTPRMRTSWIGCCGLFDVLKRSNQ